MYLKDLNREEMLWLYMDNIDMISTSEIKISCVVRGDKGKPAVRALHKEFGLGKK